MVIGFLFELGNVLSIVGSVLFILLMLAWFGTLSGNQQAAEIGIGRCKNCKHWSDVATHGEPTSGTCDNAWSKEGGAADAEFSLAVAYGENGTVAWLKTSPDFGCIQFKAKTPCLELRSRKRTRKHDGTTRVPKFR